METPFTPKKEKHFNCEKCDFICYKQSDWDRHILTAKHKKHDFGNNGNAVYAKFICQDCNKLYSSASGLWKHKKKCNIPDIEKNDDELISLVIEIVKSNSELQKQNQEFQQKILELCKNNTSSITTGDINSHNKTFNLNVFLNEQCKDAMNIMDFVDSIKLDLNDLESVGKLGYINGISNIIIKNLKALDVHMRPVHCTDLKRETMYVKSQNTWEKEDEENKNIRRAIKHIAFKNIKNLELFKELHPDCMDCDSKHGDHFLRLQIEALGGGSTNVDYDSQTKIIKNIAKEVTIDKTTI